MAYEDSSFLVTESGALYSWGKNDHNFLGRETKLDLKSTSASLSQTDRLKFSNSVPTRIRKLEKYRFSRISIKDGKFMAFFIDDLQTSVIKSEQDDIEHETYQKSRSGIDHQSMRESSEYDSEEEKDVVNADFIKKGGGVKAKKRLNSSVSSNTSLTMSQSSS